MKYCRIFFIYSFLLFVTLKASAQNLIQINYNNLVCVKDRIDKGDKDLKVALSSLIKHADSIRRIGQMPRVTNKNLTEASSDIHDYVSMATYYWPNSNTKDGLPYVPVDGKANPEVAKINNYSNLVNVSQRVQILGLAYFFTKDEKYVSSAMPLINVFFLREDTKMNPNMNHAQFIKGLNRGRMEGIIEARFFVNLLDGVQLMKESKAFNQQHYLGLQDWFRHFSNWMNSSEIAARGKKLKNNIETSYHLQRLSYATFLNNYEEVAEIYENDLKRLIKSQFSSGGEQVLELKRAKPANYSIANLKYWVDIRDVLSNSSANVTRFSSVEEATIQKAVDYIQQLDPATIDHSHGLQYKSIMNRKGRKSKDFKIETLDVLKKPSLDEVVLILTSC